jgi:Berberine and berberine like
MEPFATHWVYVNFLGDEEDGRIRAAYGLNYERLVSLKNSDDPTNFFALNQNMKPTILQNKEKNIHMKRKKGTHRGKYQPLSFLSLHHTFQKEISIRLRRIGTATGNLHLTHQFPILENPLMGQLCQNE